MSNLAKNIKRLRIENGLNQTKLAKEIHVSNSLVSHWEKGDREPNNQDLIALSKFFGCTIDELISGESIKANVSRTRQIIHVRDFKKDFKSKYLVFKALFVFLSVLIVLFFPNGSQDIRLWFFLFFLIIIIIDIVACFYTKNHIKIYDVDLEKEVKFVNKLDQKDLNKDWNSKVGFLFFLFIASIIALPIIYMILQTDSPDVGLTIISVITTLLIFANFVALIIYELRDYLKVKEINYYDFNYKLRLFLRKTLIVIYEFVFVIVYTILIFYGRNTINVNGLWVAIVFPPLLVFVSNLLYIVELKTLNDYKISII